MSYNLNFISEDDFYNHVKKTILSYDKALESMDLKRFNSNIIDPVKMTFDKNVFNNTFEELIKNEISRQRDKSVTNSIGYFHQNIFKYIDKCEVPTKGWDVIFETNEGNKIYVEMKNKHNTMNSSSSQKTYIQMQNMIINNPNDTCYLVEAIAPCSRNIPWVCSVNGKQCKSGDIRRVSMDKFYAIVTGEKDAFYKLCIQLPKTIDEVVKQNKNLTVEKDTVLEELKTIDSNIQLALYKIAFNTYEGFNF